MTAAIATAWREEEGDILAFLPGVGEIERTRERLEERLPTRWSRRCTDSSRPTSAPPSAAIPRGADASCWRRRLRKRRSRWTASRSSSIRPLAPRRVRRAAGTTHLVAHRAVQPPLRSGRGEPRGRGRRGLSFVGAGRSCGATSLRSAGDHDQRSGTAGAGRPAGGRPIPQRLRGSTPAGATVSRSETLTALGALDGDGRITPQGEARSIAARSAERPWSYSARRMARQRHRRRSPAAARAWAGGQSEDVALSRWDGDRSQRAQASRKLVERWANTARKLVEEENGGEPWQASSSPQVGPSSRNGAIHRASNGLRRVEGFQLDPASLLARAEFLAIGDAQGQAKGADHILLRRSTLQRWRSGSPTGSSGAVLRWTSQRVEALNEQAGGDPPLQGPDPEPDEGAIWTCLWKRLWKTRHN